MHGENTSGISMAYEIIGGRVDSGDKIIEPQRFDHGGYNNVAWIQGVDCFKFCSGFKVTVPAWWGSHRFLEQKKPNKNIELKMMKKLSQAINEWLKAAIHRYL